MNEISILAVTMVFLQACVPLADFEIPTRQESVVELNPNSNIAAAINSYLQSGEEIYTFPESSNAIVEALVISSDEAGNFYKTLVVQDVGQPWIKGISVRIDLRDYFSRYEFGAKIYLRLAGLSLQGDLGIYSLGFRRTGGLAPIPEALLDKFIVRTDVKLEAEVAELSPEILNQERFNTRIKINRAQFERSDLGKTFAGEPYDSYNAIRPLQFCEVETPVFLSTSVYADFRSELLTDSVFEAEGILTREYDGHLVLVLNSPEDLRETNESRCDIEFLQCEADGTEQEQEYDEEWTKKVVFYEDFEQINSTREIEEAGWLNVNIHYGSGKFVKRNSNDNGFVRISSYGTQEPVLEAWLISPPVDLDKSMEEELSFHSRATFNKGRLLSVWISTDSELDPRLAEWQQIDARISDGSADGSNERFISSGKISLDCLKGTVRIAFRYLGGDPGPSTNYDLDNILIEGKIHGTASNKA